VYGDIGTNPLFALREAFTAHPIPIDRSNVYGVLSLAFWSLIVVISLKYVTFVMRANNDGEGGILALVALVQDPGKQERGRRRLLILLGVAGAALLFGDGMITPAISVLAAVEGTTVAQPGLARAVVPVAIAILIALFVVQRRGTGTIGRLFGPVMLVWFVTIGVPGVAQIVRSPGIVAAINPAYAVSFFIDNGLQGFLVLGAVILIVVGGEALYADMGHFGRTPIATGWYVVVLPALVLVYFGQGALLLRNPGAIVNPFYRMAPSWALYPLVVLATCATVIASQALISGGYSLMQQAVQLGFAPFVRITHTSAEMIGQVYVRSVNWVLMVGCLLLVIGFRHSEALAGVRARGRGHDADDDDPVHGRCS
jgi:KUP system potassium uptake protein